MPESNDTKSKRTYPWGVWFARKRPFTLNRNVDYNGTDASFMQLVRHRAGDLGALVSCVSPHDNVVVVTVIAPPGSRKPKIRKPRVR